MATNDQTASNTPATPPLRCAAIADEISRLPHDLFYRELRTDALAVLGEQCAADPANAGLPVDQQTYPERARDAHHAALRCIAKAEARSHAVLSGSDPCAYEFEIEHAGGTTHALIAWSDVYFMPLTGADDGPSGAHLTVTTEGVRVNGVQYLAWPPYRGDFRGKVDAVTAYVQLNQGRRPSDLIEQILAPHPHLLAEYKRECEIAGLGMSVVCSNDGEDSDDWAIEELRPFAIEEGGDVGGSRCTLTAATCPLQYLHEHEEEDEDDDDD